MITMICIGFLEELIFRGFLFKWLTKKNHKRAAIISALTFGMKHIFLLFTGQDILITLLKITYAIALGLLIVSLFIKTGSLLQSMITHASINDFSIFNIENTISKFIVPIFLIVGPFFYTLNLNKLSENKIGKYSLRGIGK